MQSVQSVSVHIAVLAVGKDAAPTHAVSEAATKAGHQVVARATVSDTEAAVRAQMQRWIEDANVDVVIVSGGVESESAGAALKPLITQTLPGFTDLFRYLAFQEIGASAMLSNAEAAQCSSTFVFVLPAAVGAVKAAMEKLILPQLDSNTMPKNLVTQMPRVRALENGVPMPIAKEKTSSGSGLSARAPSSPVRKAAVTGANVIRKIDPDEDAIFDPQTKPIDVAKLEEQIALSESQNAETKQVDLARLPKVPPGADPLSDDTDQIMPGDLPTKRQARLESAPIEPPAPARRKVQRTEPSAVVPPPRPITKGGLIPEPPAPRGPISLPESGHHPIAPLPSIAAVPLERTKTPTEPPQPARTKATTGPIAVPSVIPKSTSGPIGLPKAKRQPTEPPPPPAKRPPTEPPPPPVKRASTDAEPVKRKPPTEPPPPPRPQTGPVATASKRPPSVPPPAPATRPATGPAPIVRAEPLPEIATAVALSPSPPVRRPPTKPPEMGTLIEAPLRRSGDLPAGTFQYPVKKGGGGTILFAVGALAVLALGFVGVVYVYPKLTGGPSAAQKPAEGSAETPVVAAVAIDAAVEVAPTPADAEPDEISPEFSIDPTPVGSAAAPVGPRPTRPGTPSPGGTPKQPGAGSATAAGSGSAEPEDTVENAPNNPPPAASDCDEVSCVLAKYDRPCCAQYKPKDSDIKPRTADGLPAELDKSMVRAGIEKVKPRVVACGESSAEKGTVKISVTVRPDGSVSDTSIVASPTPALGECVTAAMRKAEFGKSVGGGSFTYPFVF